MAIDANILFQAGRPTVQLEDPLNKLAQLGQVQGFQNQNALAQIQLDQARRANAQAEGLNNLYRDSIRPDGSLDQGGLITRAAQQGYGSAIPGIQKAFADADKAKADVDKTKAEITKITAESLNTALQQGRDILTQAPNAEVGRRWVISQYNDPNVGQIFKKMGTLDQVLAQYDAQTSTPEGFAKWKQGAMLTAEQLIKQTSPDANTVLQAQVSRQNNADTNATSRANNAATNATTQRGQNMTDARQRDQNQINASGKITEASTQLRKEFEQLPEVKNFKQALPAYNGIEDAAARSSPQADINLVYGIAKLYDPNSVVREGEYATVANSPNVPERVKGYIQYVQGGGKLSQKTKDQILTEARSRMQAFEDQYTGARTNYEDIAKRSGGDPTLLFPAEQKSVIRTKTKPTDPIAPPDINDLLKKYGG